MSGLEANDRLYQAFLRGYREFGDAVGSGPAIPYASLIQAASLQSKELRRSIDACRSALDQLASLPEAEQAQLRVEARASLEAMQSAAERLIAHLTGLRPPPETPRASRDGPASKSRTKPARARPAPARTRKPRSKR